MIRHLKGSRAIGFWSHYIFALERNQQADSEALQHIPTFRVLKDRYTGRATGKVFYIGYDYEPGLLYETEPPQGGEVHGFKDETEQAAKGEEDF